MQVSVIKSAAKVVAIALVTVLAGMAATGIGKTGAAFAQEETQATDPTRGAVTNLPLPRYVSLKTNEGNARRGPSLTHRIDWVFSRAGMPLRITAEYENWRRIEDAEGVGGWVHYSLLSGTRTALVTADLLDLRATPLPDGTVLLRAEAGVIARLLECRPVWCRLSIDGEKGWALKAALWGIDPDESFE
ncbi:SH3 domain-containing protein [Pseudorhodobacter sp.]|uniref:SH3 domain-containing protein n=1 Tax=Pseudorhodobacter sp. TaxID=1934400 RepID=UPI002AFE07D4|nr:SH3 domain-containing protein [Pseudorhodobacter sp.]